MVMAAESYGTQKPAEMMSQSQLEKAGKESKNRGVRLNRQTAERSITIDFEGPAGPTPKSPPPAADYLGWRVGHRGKLNGRILNPDLHFLANSNRDFSRYVDTGTLASTLCELVDVATAESRVLLHFSGHEVRVLARHLPPADFERCRPLLVDGRKLIKKHLTKTRPGCLDDIDFKLETAAEILCPKLRAGQPSVGVGRTLRELRQWSAARNRPRISNLGKSLRQRWLTLLEYNFYDLKMLHRCSIKAAR